MRKKIIVWCLLVSLCIGCLAVLPGCDNNSDKTYNVKNYATELENQPKSKVSFKSGKQLGKYESIEKDIIGITTAKHTADGDHGPITYTTYELSNIITGEKLTPKTIYHYDFSSVSGFVSCVKLKTNREKNSFLYVAFDGTVLASVDENESASLNAELLKKAKDDDGIVTYYYAVTVDIKKDGETATNYFVAEKSAQDAYAKLKALSDSISADQEYKDLAMPDVTVSTLVYRKNENIKAEPKAGSVETMYYQVHSNTSNDRTVFSFYPTGSNGLPSSTPEHTLELSTVDEDFAYKLSSPYWFLGDYLFYQKYEQKSIGRNFGNQKYTTYRYNILTGENEKIDTPFHITELTTLASVDGKHELALAKGYAYVKNVAHSNEDAVIYVLDSDLKIVQDFTFTDVLPDKDVKKLSDTRFLVGNYITDEKLNPVVDLSKYAGSFTVYPEYECILVNYNYKDTEDGNVSATINYNGEVLSDWNSLDTDRFANVYDGLYIDSTRSFSKTGLSNDYRVYNTKGEVVVDSVKQKLNVTGNTTLNCDNSKGWFVTTSKATKTFSYTYYDDPRSLDYDLYTITIYNYKMEKLVSFTSSSEDYSIITETNNGCWIKAMLTEYVKTETSYNTKTSYNIVSVNK